MFSYGLIFWLIPILVLAIAPLGKASSLKEYERIREVVDTGSRDEFEEKFRGLLLKITPVSRKQQLKLSRRQPVPEIPDSFEECRNVFHFHLLPSNKERTRVANFLLPIQLGGLGVGMLLYAVRYVVNGYYLSALNLVLACVAALFCAMFMLKKFNEIKEQEYDLLQKVDEKATGFLKASRQGTEEEASSG